MNTTILGGALMLIVCLDGRETLICAQNAARTLVKAIAHF